MKKIFYLIAAVAIMATSCSKVVDPVVSLSAVSSSIGYDGGDIRLTIASNLPWTSSVSDSKITLSPSSGDGNAAVIITVPESKSEVTLQYVITFTVAGEESTKEVTHTITQDVPSLTYGGVTYKIAQMGDGKWWMVENLRFIPSGMTPSSDPTVESGIWFPYDILHADWGNTV